MLDDEDVERVKIYHWCVFHAPKPKDWRQIYYACTNSKDLPSTLRLLHRFILNAEKGEFIDHADVNHFNTRKSNLRKCTVSENSTNRNKPTTNKSGIKGVCWDKSVDKWKAYIKKNNKSYNLGYFDSIDEAKEKRKQAEIKLQGKWALDYNKEI